ncbi:MAG: cytochrome c oxidase assembly protein, partial [Acidimicrobiia bacterium]
MPPLPDFHLHLDVLALIVILAVGWWWAETRIRPLAAPDAAAATRGQRRAWYSGVAVMLIASGYPIHDLAEETLVSFHMLEHMLIGYVVPPLLLIGLPRWMADATIAHPRIVGVVRYFTTPVVGIISFNIAIVAIHWPAAIAWQNTTEWAHFAVHVLFFLTAVSMWMPVFSPTPALPRISRPGQIMYLFMNTIVPIVPASFLTFGNSVLYPGYGDAPLTWGLTAIEDQTIAGVIMKLGGAFYLFGLIARIWFRWIGEERTLDRLER